MQNNYKNRRENGPGKLGRRKGRGGRQIGKEHDASKSVCCMLRVKEIACDNVVSQSCMCERVLCGTVVEAGHRAEKQEPHT